MMKLNVKNVLNFINNDSHIDKQGYLLKKGEVRIVKCISHGIIFINVS